MTRRHWFAIVLSAVSAAEAARLRAAPASDDQEAITTLAETGTIARFDPATNQLTLKTSRGDRVFSVAETTTIRRGPAVVPSTELSAAAGQAAKVRYTEHSGVRTASSVMLARHHWGLHRSFLLERSAPLTSACGLATS